MALISDPVDFNKPIDRSSLHGRTALVTGGASGIGAETVRALAEAGAYVTIVDLNTEAGKLQASSLVAEGYHVQFVQTDVTNWNSQLAAFKQAIEHSLNQRIDIVLACAGIAGPSMVQASPFATATDPSADPEPPTSQIAMLNVNLIGPIHTATLAAHFWRQQAPSTTPLDNVLIIMASNIAYHPLPGMTAYTAAKTGVRGFWRSLRSDPSFARLFRANLLAPHIVRSPMTAALQPLVDSRGIKMVEISDCVECLLRLCCDSDIRGRAVMVNPDGDWFDACDDLENFDGSKAFKEHQTADIQALFDMLDPSLYT